MKHIPHSSRVFIGLLVITLLLTYVTLMLSDYEANSILSTSAPLPSAQSEIQPAVEKPKLDTTEWKTYQDKNYPIAFLHPENWIVKSSTNKQNFYDIVLNPGAKFQNIHIYVSTEGYYALDGLKQTPHQIGDRQGFIATDNLAGIKVGEYYYTFDGTMNNTQLNEFSTLLSTVTFQ